ncbi:MAG: RecQ family ATP-dependent DNA helicase [Caldilineaceae bacterium]|nr:RecQ family ATP-dependent DNA helicase [Caldilineaceae bacterium]
MTNLLAQFDLSPNQIRHLPATLRNRLLDFLERWEAHAEVLACLEHLHVARFVSFQDAQAQALVGLGRADEAVTIMENRLAQKDSATARILLSRAYLAAGRHLDALAALAENSEYGPTWSLRGQIHLAQGRVDEAERAFLRHRELAPSSRLPLFGMAHLYLRRGDGVTAAAYAVQAYTVNDGERPLSVGEVREARDLFRQLADANRRNEAEQSLAQQLESEISHFRALLSADGSGQAPSTAPVVEPGAAPEPRTPPMSDLATIPVSEDEARTLTEAARHFFGFPALRSGQAQVMAAARRGEDVLAILPTGAGKSLCYQLPILLDGGMTLVISPLIALMKDQVDNLPPALRAQSVAINSSMEGDALTEAIRDLAAGRYRLVYAAPERLRQLPFLHALRRAGLSRLVIDEAHCVSAWGHDFRPDYLYIAEAHRRLGSPPILALTATAPTQVRRDIERQLFGIDEGSQRRLQIVALDSFRPNLRLATINVGDKDGKYGRLLDLCQSLDGSGIVYARTRRDCEEVATILISQGVDAVHYHAGIPDRAGVQDRFMRGDVRVIVATIAFGMGIDKADIRFIIHFGLPDSLEAYYQEAGRAGRDGDPAHCVLMYSSSDKGRLTRNANRDALTIDFLRELYGAVKKGRRLGSFVMMPLDDLARPYDGGDTRVRVGLSFLEQTALLRRYVDAPRAVTLRLIAAGKDAQADRFVAAARLRPQQPVDRSYAELCAQVAIAPDRLEAELLAWQEAGILDVNASGRDLLIELLPPPVDGTERINALLDRYAAIGAGRIDEIVAYARSPRCLHGHIANYLGGAGRSRCTVCNRCMGDGLLPSPGAGLPSESEQLRMILWVLSNQSWGRRGLIYLLRGDEKAGERGQRSKAFGRMNFRSESVLDRMIDGLIADGAIVESTLSHGGIVLSITEQGRAMLANPK